MTNTFIEIDRLIPTLHGWCDAERAKLLASAVHVLREEVSVVIGVWGGRDTFALALAHKAIGRGMVHAIDPWSPDASALGQFGANAAWWKSQADHELVYRDFMTHLQKLDLQTFIKVIRAKSDDVKPPERIGVFICDGNHGEQAEKDVERFAPKVINGGFVFMDDLEWEGGAVLRAAAKLKANGFRELYRLGQGAVFQRLV